MNHATQTAALPQLGGTQFLTDGGIETVLIFDEGMELPLFAAYALLDDPVGRAKLKGYYRRYLGIAEAAAGFVLESPTWRCSKDWGARLGHDAGRIADFNRQAITLMQELKRGSVSLTPIVVSGNIGPRGDGYRPETMMTPDESEAYHAHRHIGSIAKVCLTPPAVGEGH